MPSDAIPADSLLDASASASAEVADQPAVRRMSGLPRAAVWAVLIVAPWVAIVQAIRLAF